MEKTTLIGLAVFAVILIGGFLIFGGGGPSSSNIGEGGVREITIDAKRFDFGPEISVNQGEKIRLKINNLDTLHGVKIPSLGVSGDDIVEFVASEKGEFEFFCNNYCGESHMDMTGKIIVE